MTDPGTSATGPFERPRDVGLDAPGIALGAEPLVSIVMTAFNSAATLEHALRACLAQTWPRLEVLLVDDASTDGGVALALRLADADARLRVLRMDRNVGTYAAKNAGIAAARGEVLAFMDSDDDCAPQRIATQLERLRAPGLVATTCNYVRRTADGTLVLNGRLEARQALISLMVKRRVVDEVGWFDPVRTSADDEFFERIRHTYGRAAHANVPEALYTALHHEASLSVSGPGANDLAADDGEAVLSAPRRAYQASYRAWYDALAQRGCRPYLPRHPAGRPFEAPPEVRGAGQSRQ
jgi:glycosyltransferase involved in cell wall biosynthesis